MRKLSVTTRIHPEFLEMHVEGHYHLLQAIAEFLPVLGACRVLGIRKILIDFSEVQGDISAVEKVLYALGVVEHIATYRASGGRELRIAYLGSTKHVTNYRPGLQVARANHIDAEVFTNAAVATQWLNESRMEHAAAGRAS